MLFSVCTHACDIVYIYLNFCIIKYRFPETKTYDVFKEITLPLLTIIAHLFSLRRLLK